MQVQEPKPLVQAPTEKTQKTLEKSLERSVEIPPIEDILAKAEAASKQIQKAKQAVLKSWNCTECDSFGIQLYCTGGGHFKVALDEDNTPVDPTTGTPLQGRELTNFLCIRKRGRVCGGSECGA